MKAGIRDSGLGIGKSGAAATPALWSFCESPIPNPESRLPEATK
jgi:hypothetical protein